MNLQTWRNIQRHKGVINYVTRYDNATGDGVDVGINPNPNNYLATIVSSKDEIIKILTIIALVLTIWLSIVHLKKIYK